MRGADTTRPSLDVVTVTYNSRKHIDGLIASVRASAGVDAGIVVVDNASTDGTADHIRNAHPEVTLIASAENLGFAAGANAGARASTAPTLAFVNPDVELDPACLAILASDVEDRAIGMVGPQQHYPDGSWQRSSGAVPGVAEATGRVLGIAKLQDRLAERRLQRGDGDRVRDVGYVDGAVMVMRRPVFEAVGGFDEAFFLYAEEADLCARVRDRGLRVVLDQRAAATHVRGGSWSPDLPEQVRRTLMGQRAKYQLVRKRSRGPVGPWCYSFLWMVHSFNRGLAARLARRRRGDLDTAYGERIELSKAEVRYWRSNLT
jgi:N-acetylglucosaminyl-diphospho-decaprenol L-rhamnosyltransferase